MKEIEVGSICLARAGRDKGKYFIVSEVLEGGYVSIVDGKTRKLSKPKRKKRMHLRPAGAASGELVQALKAGIAQDARVREALATVKES